MTLKVLKGAENPLVLTLSELASASLPNNWLFVFTNEQSEEQTKLYLPDVSDHTDRFNKFYMTEGEDQDIEMSLGWHQYDVYQMPDGGSTDESIGVHVEMGKVIVIDPEEEQPAAYDAQITSKVYER